jgi:ubiquinone/menaquinone biosynthesis C-methylase UbiE
MKDLKNKIKDNFTNTYKNDLWHMGSGESKSGLGSSLAYTVHFRRELLEIIKKYNLIKIFDCSCGDWNWMKTIKESLPYYIGNDVVEHLIDSNKLKYGSDNIHFVCNDMLSQLKTYSDNELDLVICRHTLEHLPTDYSIEVLLEIKRVSKYSIITSSKHDGKKNTDIEMDGHTYRPVNLSEDPYFNYIESPIYMFLENTLSEKREFSESTNGCFGYLYKFN